jgi:hypothetical protein
MDLGFRSDPNLHRAHHGPFRVRIEARQGVGGAGKTSGKLSREDRHMLVIVMERKVVEERAHTKPAACHRRDATSNCLRQQGSLISPFPVSPSGGKPGRVGSPHAAGTLCASQKRWHTSMPRLPPMGTSRVPMVGLDRDRSRRKKLRMAATSALTFTTFS